MSDWILIEDGSPSEKQAVIYYFKHVGVHRGNFQTTDYGEDLGLDENEETYKGNCFYSKSGFLTDDVTHWLPDNGQELPNPPV